MRRGDARGAAEIGRATDESRARELGGASEPPSFRRKPESTDRPYVW